MENHDQIIENLNAQLSSIDRLRNQSDRALHEAQTNLILKDNVINKLLQQINELKKQVEELQAKKCNAILDNVTLDVADGLHEVVNG